jgi:hypothetical protein
MGVTMMRFAVCEQTEQEGARRRRRRHAAGSDERLAATTRVRLEEAHDAQLLPILHLAEMDAPPTDLLHTRRAR